MLKNAIQKAKSKHENSKEEDRRKRLSRPVTAGGIINFFHDLYFKYDIKGYVPLKKDDYNKVNGFIKLLRNNHYSDEEIYAVIEEIFSQWDQIKEADIKTDNRKSYILNDSTDLLDIVKCKNDIFREITKENEPEDENKSLLEIWRES